MHTILEQLFAGENLSQQTSCDVFNEIIQGKISDIQLSSLLTALKIKGETPAELAGAAQALIAHARPFPQTNYEVVDIVGTGGDGHDTINISSASAIVAASCGLKVAKHGNRSVSSRSGSADLFAAFGVNLTMSPDTAAACLQQTNLCFLFAPNYHPGIKHAMPVRTDLKTRTLFNLLGPLVNPAKPSQIMIGVYHPQWIQPFAETLQLLGYQNAMVVHGSGLDELALHGSSTIAHIADGALSTKRVTARDFGLDEQPLNAIKGADPQTNKRLIQQVLEGKGQQAHRDAVILNTAPLLVLAGKYQKFEEAAMAVRQSLATGSAIETVYHSAKISQQGV